MSKTTEAFEAWWADTGEQSLFALGTTMDEDIKTLAGIAWEAATREVLADHVEQNLTMVAEPVQHNERYWLHEINNARADGYERGYMAAKKLYAEPVKQEPVAWATKISKAFFNSPANGVFQVSHLMRDEYNVPLYAAPVDAKVIRARGEK